MLSVIQAARPACHYYLINLAPSLNLVKLVVIAHLLLVLVRTQSRVITASRPKHRVFCQSVPTNSLLLPPRMNVGV